MRGFADGKEARDGRQGAGVQRRKRIRLRIEDALRFDGHAARLPAHARCKVCGLRGCIELELSFSRSFDFSALALLSISSSCSEIFLLFLTSAMSTSGISSLWHHMYNFC